MATASASWASGPSAPMDMAAESKRGNSLAAGSTCSSATGVVPCLRTSRSRRVATGRSFTRRAYSL
ncbi:hypothetical protein D3C78_848290 [compost metagenome]